MKTDIYAHIITLEKKALEKWNAGDPSGYLDLSADDVVYFDPFIPARLNGLTALTEYYGKIRNTIHVDSYDMLEPHVQYCSEIAVLTFNLNSYEGSNTLRWNCTEVFRQEKEGQWKIIQTHWSLVQPTL